jgi:hypothetical protein
MWLSMKGHKKTFLPLAKAIVIFKLALVGFLRPKAYQKPIYSVRKESHMLFLRRKVHLFLFPLYQKTTFRII